MSTIYLDRQLVGPGDKVIGTLHDGSLDFSSIPVHLVSHFQIRLLGRGGSSASLVFTLDKFLFLDKRRVEFEIPPVGPLTSSGTQVPEGFYQVLFSFSFWSAVGDKDLHIVLNPTAIRPKKIPIPPGSFLLTIRNALMRITLPLKFFFSSLITSFPLSLLTGKLTIHMIAHRRSTARRMRSFFTPAPPGSPTLGTTSVEPLIDGEENFEAIRQLILNAESFIYMGYWGFDENTKVNSIGQHDPDYISKDNSIEELLKNKIAQNTPSSLQIKLLSWDEPVFNEYESPFTEVGDLDNVQLRWGDVKGSSPQDFLNRIRRYSGANEQLLLDFYNGYQNAAGDEMLYFPTGIQIALDEHPLALLASHHQKFVLTDKGFWIGGLNILRQCWDSKEHFIGDERRAHSGGLLSGIPGGFFDPAVLSMPDVLDIIPWHDTGAIVRGSANNDAIKEFVERWDKAVMARGPFDCILQKIHLRFSDIARVLSDHSLWRSYRVKGTGAPLHASTTVDTQHLVDDASVAVTLPKGSGWASTSGVTNIKDHYMQSIDVMDHPDTFIYIENQYYTDFSISKKLFNRWLDNVSGLTEIEEPFAFIVIPYKPDVSSNPGASSSGGGSVNIVEAEMKNLKWLEIRTARTIYERDSEDQWKPKCDVDSPQTNIEFTDYNIQSNPEDLEDDSEFKVKNAIRLDANGNRIMVKDPITGQDIPDRFTNDLPFEAQKVMTHSDIMAYCLVSTRQRGGTIIVPVGGGGGVSVRNRVGNFIEGDKNLIYIHSKAALFLNFNSDLYWATLGSANTNPRSLGQKGDKQDSEMNIWWRGADAVWNFWTNLWSHHLRTQDPNNLTRQYWAETAWDNMVAIMRANSTHLNGDVVRLDVIERYHYL